MTLPVPSVRVFFDSAQNEDAFTLNDPVKGQLDDATYTLGGDVGTLLEDTVLSMDITIDRGRERELDEFQVGTCRVGFNDFDRIFDPLNSAGPLYGQLVPGKRVVVTVYEGQVIFSGVIQDWDLNWSQDRDAVIGFTAHDALGVLGEAELDAFTATGGQTSGQRLAAVLNRPEVGFPASRALDDGVSTLQADDVEQGTGALGYCQLVNRSEVGRLFVEREGVLRFLDRHHELNATVWAEFRDDGLELPFHAVEVTTGSDLLHTRVVVERLGGSTQTADDEDAQAAYGVRTLTRDGLLLDSDLQSENMSEWLLNLYKDPETRISALEVDVTDIAEPDPDQGGGGAAPAGPSTVTMLDIGYLIRVVWTPGGSGVQVDETLVVEGVSHRIRVGGQHIVRFALSHPAQLGQSFILDHETYGLLDGPYRIGF